jgi:hypothetical protein
VLFTLSDVICFVLLDNILSTLYMYIYCIFCFYVSRHSAFDLGID